MAGVNNQANIKPLIDEQTSKIDVDNYWRFKNIENKVAESQQVIEAGQAQASNDVELKLTHLATTFAQAMLNTQTAVNESVNTTAHATESAIISKLIALTNALSVKVDALPTSPIKSIQRGNIRGAGTVSVGNIDIAKSVLNISCSSGKGTYSGDDKQWSIVGGGYIKSINEIVIQAPFSYNNNFPPAVYWELIEYV